MRNDRLSALEQWELSGADAIANEVERGLDAIASGETAEGSERFRDGEGRHGRFASGHGETEDPTR